MSRHMIFKNHIFIIALSVFMLAMAPQAHSQQVAPNTPAQPAAGGCVPGNCGNSTCVLGKANNGVMTASSTRPHPNITCVMQQNLNGNNCFDPIPMSYVPTVNIAAEPGSRKRGDGSLRNHNGADYGTGGATGVKAKAAADGTIISCRLTSGGGRTIFMEHEKKCQCTAGNAGTGPCNPKYTTVYMHLAAWVVNGQQYNGSSAPAGCAGRQVKKGDWIGVVGGSNYVTRGQVKVLVDAPDPGSYARHLHFEVYSGAGTYASPGIKDAIVSPLCSDIQGFCGGCSTPVSDSCGAMTAEQINAMGGTVDGYGSGSTAAAGGAQSEAEAAMAKCSLQQYIPSADECYFCPIFKTIFNTASIIALKSYNALSKGVANLVIAGFAIWLSLVVLKNIASMETKDPRKMLQEILVQAFRVFVVWLILQGSFFQVMQLTLAPVFNTGMFYTQAVTGVQECPESAPYMQNIFGYGETFEEGAKGGLPLSMGKSVVCTIKTIQDSVSIIMAYGRQAMCLSWEDPYVFLWVIPHFPMLITGVCLWIGGVILLLAFPWCLVDCVLNMCIAAGLAPAAIGAWAFKITANYLKKIWDFFMNAMFNFVFLGLIIFVIVTVVDQFMKRLTDLGEDVSLFTDPINGLAYWGVTFLQLFVVCLLGWVVLDEGKNTAKKFASAPGGGGSGIGRTVGGAFMQAGKRAGQVAGKGAKAVGKAGLQIGDHFVGAEVRRKFNNMRINRTKNKGKAITDAQGNIVGYERTRRNLLTGFKRVTSRVNVNADGTETWSRESQSWAKDLRGAMIRKINKRRLKKLQKSGTPIRDAAGNIVGYTRTKRPWYRLGKQVTLTAMKNQNGEMEFNKKVSSWRMEALALVTGGKLKKIPLLDKIHSFAVQNKYGDTKNLAAPKESKILSSDHMMAIRQKRDKNGNIISQDIKFKSNSINYLVNKDGTVNMALYDQVMAGTRLDKDVVQMALALEVLKKRNIAVSDTFKQRSARVVNGVLVFSQTNNDGSKIEFTSSFGGRNGDQMLLDMKSTQKNGDFVRILDNGDLSKTINYSAKKNEATAQYKFAEHVHKLDRFTDPIDGNGTLAAHLDQEKILYGFDPSELAAFAQQNANRKARKGNFVSINPATAGVQNTVMSMFGQSVLLQNGRVNISSFNRFVSSQPPAEREIAENMLVLETIRRRKLDLDPNATVRRLGIKGGSVFFEADNPNGSKTEFNATIGGPKSDQVLIEIKRSDGQGSYLRTVDNGVLKKSVLYNAGDASASVGYTGASSSDYDDSVFGLSHDDWQNFQDQLNNTGTYPTVDPTEGGTMDRSFV